MKLFAPTVDANPVLPAGVASKDYVDQKLNAGLGTVIVGNVYITDIVPSSTGIVGSKTYAGGTVPANAVLTDATSDTSSITVNIFAEGGNAFYSPSITVNGVQATLTKIASDSSRVYTGQATLTIGAGDTTIDVVSSTGATATFANPSSMANTPLISMRPTTFTSVMPPERSLTFIVASSSVIFFVLLAGLCCLGGCPVNETSMTIT